MADSDEFPQILIRLVDQGYIRWNNPQATSIRLAHRIIELKQSVMPLSSPSVTFGRQIQPSAVDAPVTTQAPTELKVVVSHYAKIWDQVLGRTEDSPTASSQDYAFEMANVNGKIIHFCARGRIFVPIFIFCLLQMNSIP